MCAEGICRPCSNNCGWAWGACTNGPPAGSIALIFMLPEAECQQLIDNNAQCCIGHPFVQHVNAAVVFEQVQNARRRSFSVNLRYYLPGEGGIGLPIRGTNPCETNGAISFIVPRELMTDAGSPRSSRSCRRSVRNKSDRLIRAMRVAASRLHQRRSLFGLLPKNAE